ncbi:helix-turn-helix DNA-binding domain protein [Gordonia phage Phendrix]|uniref:Helix-turn-helix DNA binding domain protein n=2 Tax=Godonkavirus TaxID=2733178 RepID=A0A4D6E2R8_9CAUD|nr:helix-turn-helix DNA binding domain protein [Gordonia phage GodonK]YP_010649208.1 helix-turn-helix DNA-binding domain protein [Gordonia phage Phendrix]QBZ72794.1 helix-turn-helix DNA-binding domain protein [Gordonia phage GodonK]QDK02710.1 helix-turn-helix DNA-binding domain protein [Gordonia phage Phendrix]
MSNFVDDLNLTPSEELLYELLVARTRLGHTWWTCGDNRTSRKAAESLAFKGVIHTMHGIVEHTFRAKLTDEAIEDLLESYVPPILGGPL